MGKKTRWCEAHRRETDSLDSRHRVQIGKDNKCAIWRVRQIKTGNELFREGERMHHRVVTYNVACMRGDISIWSLTSEFPHGRVNRSVTVEVTYSAVVLRANTP